MLKGRHFDSSVILLCVLCYAAYGVRAGHRLAHIGSPTLKDPAPALGVVFLSKSMFSEVCVFGQVGHLVVCHDDRLCGFGSPSSCRNREIVSVAWLRRRFNHRP